MTSLHGSIKLSAEAGRNAQLCCIYRCALAPFDPMVRAKVIGTQVLFLLLGDSHYAACFLQAGKHALRMSAYLHAGVGQSWTAAF